ncbi:unnamed protein product [Adineta steineri]|uniref:Uncharacterized protein n=1 Tax=Adineta steineri TaxID=433720 RepID=A0A815YTN7_9BILA|nr:unnamed protein product [Adineta steineri]CAF1574029.1 unnamed protein product [Adineta steineri]
MISRKLINLVYTQSIGLNIFPLRDFGSSVDQGTAKRLGRWSTRLYIGLLITGLAILALYNLVQPQSLTKTFNRPSFDLYHQLNEHYGDKLKCSCSLIASTYDQFVKIQPLFHEICSSPFASDQWRINLTAGLVPNLTEYEQRDYRRFLSAHLQFLTGLCQLSMNLQCSPLLCSYTYSQQFNLLYTITLLLGLQGGLTIVLKWICPKILQIVEKVYQHRKKRTNIVQPVSSLEITVADHIQTDIGNPTNGEQSTPMTKTSQYAVFLFI